MTRSSCVKSRRSSLSSQSSRSGGAGPGTVRALTEAPAGVQCASVRVVVRVRPESARERSAGCGCVVQPVDDRVLVFDPDHGDQHEYYQGRRVTTRNLLKKQPKNCQYMFDRVFQPQHDNEQVFSATMPELVAAVLDGYNCSVFAYGSTGAGKTFTMLGTAQSPGIVFLTVQHLYDKIDTLHNKKHEVRVSYLEVYNECVKDLLTPGKGDLVVREDGQRLVTVSGLTQMQPTGPQHLMSLLELGNKNRTQHPTDMNAESSRSHAVFQIWLKQYDSTSGTSADIRMSKLSLIDLAGSERGSATGNKGARFREGANINKSLLALGSCINALASGKPYVPYRASKLTRLLKDSIGGNCRTLMIAAVTASSDSYDNTHNTLRYAVSAKSIRTKLQRNVLSVDLNVAQYARLNADLMLEVAALKSRLADADTRLTAAESRVSTAESRVSAAELRASAAESRASAAETALAGQTVAVESVSSSVETQADRSQSRTVDQSDPVLVRSTAEEDELRREVEVSERRRREVLSTALRLESECHQLRVRVHRRRVARKLSQDSGGGCEDRGHETRLLRQLSHNYERLKQARHDLQVAERSAQQALQALEQQRTSSTLDTFTLFMKCQLELCEYRVLSAHLDTMCRLHQQELSRQDQLCQLVLPAVHSQYLVLQHLNHVTPDMTDQRKAIAALSGDQKGVCWADLRSPLETRSAAGQSGYDVSALLRLSATRHVPAEPWLMFGRSGVLRASSAHQAPPPSADDLLAASVAQTRRDRLGSPVEPVPFSLPTSHASPVHFPADAEVESSFCTDDVEGFSTLNDTFSVIDRAVDTSATNRPVLERAETSAINRPVLERDETSVVSRPVIGCSGLLSRLDKLNREKYHSTTPSLTSIPFSPVPLAVSQDISDLSGKADRCHPVGELNGTFTLSQEHPDNDSDVVTAVTAKAPVLSVIPEDVSLPTSVDDSSPSLNDTVTLATSPVPSPTTDPKDTMTLIKASISPPSSSRKETLAFSENPVSSPSTNLNHTVTFSKTPVSPPSSNLNDTVTLSRTPVSPPSSNLNDTVTFSKTPVPPPSTNLNATVTFSETPVPLPSSNLNDTVTFSETPVSPTSSNLKDTVTLSETSTSSPSSSREEKMTSSETPVSPPPSNLNDTVTFSETPIPPPPSNLNDTVTSSKTSVSPPPSNPNDTATLSKTPISPQSSHLNDTVTLSRSPGIDGFESTALCRHPPTLSEMSSATSPAGDLAIERCISATLSAAHVSAETECSARPQSSPVERSSARLDDTFTVEGVGVRFPRPPPGVVVSAGCVGGAGGTVVGGRTGTISSSVTSTTNSYRSPQPDSAVKHARIKLTCQSSASRGPGYTSSSSLKRLIKSNTTVRLPGVGKNKENSLANRPPWGRGGVTNNNIISPKSAHSVTKPISSRGRTMLSSRSVSSLHRMAN